MGKVKKQRKITKSITLDEKAYIIGEELAQADGRSFSSWVNKLLLENSGQKQGLKQKKIGRGPYATTVERDATS